MTDEAHDLIYTTIPYDEGWNVTVDGEAVEITTACGALLAVDASSLPEGVHTVVFTYMPKCYVIGFAISMGGIVLLALCLGVRCLAYKLKERTYAMKYESVAPDMPADDDTSCIPLAELLAEVEAERAQTENAPALAEASVTEPTAAGNAEPQKELPPTSELTPEEAAEVLRDLFPEDGEIIQDDVPNETKAVE